MLTLHTYTGDGTCTVRMQKLQQSRLQSTVIKEDLRFRADNEHDNGFNC